MKSLKKVLGLGAALAAVAFAAQPAMAQTTVTGTWNGAGNGTFTATAVNSTQSNFSIGGNLITGQASFSNLQNNPYGYGVDSTTFDAAGEVQNGGFVQFGTNRTGSYAPMYGAAGQSIGGVAQSSDGAASLSMFTNVNYAGMNHIGYGHDQTPGGNTLDASGSAIMLNYVVDTGQANNNAGVLVSATGQAGLKFASSGASANGFNMGQGQGIYTQGLFTGSGVGQMSTGAVATGQINIANNGAVVYGTNLNPASVTTTVNYDTTNAGANQTWNVAIGGTKN